MSEPYGPRDALPAHRCDVLVVGAGPTGLTAAAQLHAGGASVRIVDRNLDRTRESRALGVQPRTLEVLRPFGLAGELVRRGNPAVQLRIHAGGRVARAPLFDIGLDDTAFPFLLFVSQAETEAVLGEYLLNAGIAVERGVTFETFRSDGDALVCTLRHGDGTGQTVRARYVAGCDGAHSTVRQLAAIPFRGGRYPHTFLLADLAVDGLEPGTVNAFFTDRGPLLFFPLGRPAPWRLIALRPRQPDEAPDVEEGDAVTRSVSLAEMQLLADQATGGRVRLRDPVWATAFRLDHRQAARYQAGRMFLAGDAAHVHSPVGAQGMNTGIQDAVNLGWKLALVCRGAAPEELLNSYDAERRPVGAFVLRFTDRAFIVVTSPHPVIRAVRTHVLPRVLPLLLGFRAGRAAVFRTVSQLGISYRRSPAVVPSQRPLRGPRPGDRLPDAEVMCEDRPVWLQEELGPPVFHLLLAGPASGWEARVLSDLEQRYGGLLQVHQLDRRHGRGALFDPDGRAWGRLRVRDAAQLVVRPDGHIGYRADHRDLAGAQAYLARWLTGAP